MVSTGWQRTSVAFSNSSFLLLRDEVVCGLEASSTAVLIHSFSSLELNKKMNQPVMDIFRTEVSQFSEMVDCLHQTNDIATPSIFLGDTGRYWIERNAVLISTLLLQSAMG